MKKDEELTPKANEYVFRICDAFKLIRENPLDCFIQKFVTDPPKKEAAEKYVKEMKANPYYCKALQNVNEPTRKKNIIDHIVSNFKMESKVMKPGAVAEVVQDTELSDHNIVLGFWQEKDEQFSNDPATSNGCSTTTNSCSDSGSALKRKRSRSDSGSAS